MLESAQGSVRQGQRQEEVLVCPYHQGSTHTGERVKDRGQIGCISTEVIRPICVMWLQTEQTAVSSDEILPMLPEQRQINILLTMLDHSYGGNGLCCHLIVLSKC